MTEHTLPLKSRKEWMVKMTNVNSSPKARLPRALRRFNVLHFGWSIVRAVILLGLCFLILYPFFIKIVNGFKSLNDFLDPTVKYLPKEPTWDNWITAFKKMDYVHSLLRTLSVSLICGVLQTLISALVGYGFARFRFRGSKILFASVILVLLVPPQTIRFPGAEKNASCIFARSSGLDGGPIIRFTQQRSRTLTQTAVVSSPGWPP